MDAENATQGSRSRPVLRVLGWSGLVLVSSVAGFVGFFGSAVLVRSLAGLIAGALAASGLAALLLAALAARIRRQPRPWRWALRAALVAAPVFLALLWVVLFRRPEARAVPVPERDLPFERWELETGSRLAVARVPGRVPASGVPLVFLHGGPGTPLHSGSIPLLRRIREEGIDVVAYDQAGAGLSERLEPREYTVARMVADLEALRVRLHAERISLIGGSWGARLAYEYLAAHPDRVARVVFASVPPLTAGDWEFDLRRTGATKANPGFPPFFIAALILARISPDAAFAFAPREQLDAVFPTLEPAILGRMYCRGSVPAEPPTLGGVDGAQFLTIRLEIVRHAAPPPPASPPPALVLRPECDFMPWTAARDYRDRLQATLVPIPRMGHVVTPDAEPTVARLVAAFLRDEPLPLPRYEGAEDPAGEPGP